MHLKLDKEEKELIYGGITYSGFTITKDGQIRNVRKNRVYKLSKSPSGYLMVYLPMGHRGSVKGVRVHKAVAETYLPNPDKLPIVHHKDGNRGNPSLENLEWVTNKQNVYYAHEEARKKNELYNNKKLLEDEVRNIRCAVANGSSLGKEAKKYGVSKVTISNLVKYKTYRNVL